MPSPKIRKKPTNKRCEKGFPCKTTCISRAKNCRKPLKWQAETFALWLKAQEERLAITNQKRERAGLAPAQLTEHGYITADRTRVSPSENKAAIASPVPGSKTVGKSRKAKGLSDVIKQEVARPPSSLEKEVMAENKAIAAPSPNRTQDKLNAPKKLTLKEFEQLQVNDPVLFSVKRNGVTDYVKGRITKKHESSIYVEYPREGGGVTQRSEPRTNLFRVTNPLEILPEKSIKMMRDAIASVDINKLEEMLHTGNQSWRKMFEQSEGITLPKTIKGTHDAITDWAKQRGVQKTSLDNEPKAIEEMPDQWADYIPKVKGLLPKGERGKFGNVNVTIHGNYAYGSDKGKWVIYDAPSRQPIIAVGNRLTAQMATHEMLRVMDGKSYHDLLKSSSLSEDDFYSIYSKKVNEITTATAKPNAKELKAIAKITDAISQSQAAIAANQEKGYEYLGKTETEHPVGDDGDKIVMEYRLRPATSDDFYRDSPILMGDKFILEKRRSEIFGGQKQEGDWAIAGRGKTKKDALMGVASSSDFRKMKSEHPDVKMAINEYDQGRSKANESAKSKQRASEVESARKTLQGHQNHLSLLREKDPQFKTDYGKKERKRIGDSIDELFVAYPELVSEFAGIKESLKPQRGKVATPSFEQAVVTEVADKKNNQAKTTSASDRTDDRLMAILKKKPHEMTEDEFNFARQDVLQRLGSIPLNSGEMVRQQDKIAKETREKLKGLGVETYTGSQYSSQGYAYAHIGLGVYYPRNIPQKVRAQAEKVISDAQAKIKKLDQDRQSQIDALGLPSIAFEIIMPGKLHSNYVFYHNLESKQDAKAKGSAIASNQPTKSTTKTPKIQEGVLLGSEFVREDVGDRYGDGTNAGKYVEYRVRKVPASEVQKYGYGYKGNIALERRAYNDSTTGRYWEGEWEPVDFAPTTKQLLEQHRGTLSTLNSDHPYIKTIKENDSRAKEQAKADQERDRQAAEKRRVDHKGWMETHVNQQYANALPGKKFTLHLDLIGEDDSVPTAPVSATRYGNLAVHKKFKRMDESGTVHLGSDYSISDPGTGVSVVPSIPTLDQARKLSAVLYHEVSDKIPAEWTADEKKKAKNIIDAFLNGDRPSHITDDSTPTIRQKKGKTKTAITSNQTTKKRDQ